MHAERIDGFNPLAVIDAYRRKKEILDDNGGPILLDVITYRFSGHSTSDAMAYRTKEEMDLWSSVDPVISYKNSLIDAGIAGEDEFTAIWVDVKERITKICSLASDVDISPIY